MDNFIISATSTVDLDLADLSKNNISWIGFNYELDGKEYRDDLGKTISLDDFYKAMVDGAMTKTSQITYADYRKYFESLLEKTNKIVHLCLSSGITGEYSQAVLAKRDLEEENKDIEIYVIDSLTATSCQGLLLKEMVRMKGEGKSAKEVYEFAEDYKKYIHGWFFTSDLTYLVRGGRLSKAAGSFGNLLSICPLIEVNKEGKLIVREKIRTKKKAKKALIKKIRELRDSDFPSIIYIVHTHLEEDAISLKEELVDLGFKGEIEIHEIGTTIGAHLGPGTLGACFWGEAKEI